MKPTLAPSVPFLALIDLASERLGGRAIAANDEFFAEKENLLKPGRGEFIDGKYTDHGKWMDGWETRRRRTPGHDWCIIQLAFPGIVKGVDLDTNHFLGNAINDFRQMPPARHRRIVATARTGIG